MTSQLLGHLFPIGHRQTEFRENFLLRDRLVVLEPFVGLSDGFAFGIAQSVPILAGRDHGFEQMNHSGELSGVDLVEQLMGVSQTPIHVGSNRNPLDFIRQNRYRCPALLTG